jgi:hypothetical protein
MNPEVIRSLERLLGVVIAGFTVYLGFRLFLALPATTDSSGKVVLPGGVNIYLSRIGPGAFFALFGCVVVAISFLQQVKVDRTRPTAASPEVTTSYLGAVSGGPPESTAEQRELRLKNARGTLASLNQFAPPLLAQLPASERNSFRLALEDSKLALLASVWQNNWGSFSAFQEWIHSGRQSPAPDTFRKQAVELFDQGQASPR